MSKKQRTLSHQQFYLLTEAVKTHRDGIESLSSWNDAVRFVSKKLEEQGHSFHLSPHSLESACSLVGIKPSKPRNFLKGNRGHSRNRDDLHTVIRAVYELYKALGQQPTEGLERVYQFVKNRHHGSSNGTGDDKEYTIPSTH